MNYTSLQNSIASWFARTDLPTDTFIDLAETDMNTVLRLTGMEVYVSATPEDQTPDGVWYLTYPEGFLELKTIHDGNTPLEYVTPQQMREGFDAFYSLSNNTILLGDADAVDLVYYQRVPALSATNQTNLFTEVASSALLYLSLGHAASYMKDSDTYTAIGVQAIERLQRANDAAYVSGPLVQGGM